MFKVFVDKKKKENPNIFNSTKNGIKSYFNVYRLWNLGSKNSFSLTTFIEQLQTHEIKRKKIPKKISETRSRWYCTQSTEIIILLHLFSSFACVPRNITFRWKLFLSQTYINSIISRIIHPRWWFRFRCSFWMHTRNYNIIM